MTNDPISDALNLAPMQQLLPAEKTRIEKEITAEDDFQYARGNMINILEKGNEALDGIMDVASQSQHPRAYEVLSSLIKTLADTNKDLLTLSKTKKELEIEDPSNAPKTINNNLFVGSTMELQQLLKKNGEN